MNKKTNEDKINNLSFEDALKELENITENFEEGNSSIENAVASYERGVLLKKHCEKKLEEAKKKIDEVKIINPDTNTETKK